MERRWLPLVCVMLISSGLPAQQRVLDNGSEAFFDRLDSRVYVEALPPRTDRTATTPPALTDLLPQAPWAAERRELVLGIDFDGYNLEANPQRFLFLQREVIDLVPDGRAGQALRIRNTTPEIAGITRPLDPNRLAGRTLELSARVLLEAPYQLPPDPQSWYRPIIQLRWERPHPDEARRAKGDTLREWHSIFETPRGTNYPPTFVPDGKFHTYRARLVAPDDLTGAMLQVVVQKCRATMVVDDITLTVVETAAERQLAAGAAVTSGNLLGEGTGFELGLTRGAVTGERRLSPVPDGPEGRDFGQWRLVEGEAPEGRRALAITIPAGGGATFAWPWLGLAAGQPYTFSVWLRASRDGVKGAFGLTDAHWRMLGSAVELDTRWRRYAGVFVPPHAPQGAFWPWVSLDRVDAESEVQLDALQLEPGRDVSTYRAPAGCQLVLDTGEAPGPGWRGVLSEQQPLLLKASLLHTGDANRVYRLRGVLESHTGRLYRQLDTVPAEANLVPGEPQQLLLYNAPLPRGLYRFWLTATDAVSGTVYRTERIIAVFGAPRAARFGFHDGPGAPARTTAVAAAAHRLGADWLRTGDTPTADWREHWLGESRYDWSLFDAMVDGWKQQRISLLHTIGPRLEDRPAWLSERFAAQFRKPSAGGEAILPPKALWTSYLRALATRFVGRIAAYEVLSAPDQALSPTEYLELLKAARETIRAIDRPALVVGPAIANPASALPGGWLEQFLAKGGAELIDVLSVQLDSDYPEHLDDARDHLRRLAAKYGKPVWDTRHRYAEAPLHTDRLNPRGAVDRSLYAFSPNSYDGAAFWARHELLLAAAGVQRSFLGPSVAEVEYLHEPVGPLIETDGSPRSSLAALATIASELAGATPLGEWRWDLTLPGPPADYDYRRPHGVRAVAFGTAPDRCLVALWTWQRDASVTIELPAAKQARVVLCTGEVLPPPADGKLLLTHAPLYLADLPRAALAEVAALTVRGVAGQPPPGG